MANQNEQNKQTAPAKAAAEPEHAAADQTAASQQATAQHATKTDDDQATLSGLRQPTNRLMRLRQMREHATARISAGAQGAATTLGESWRDLIAGSVAVKNDFLRWRRISSRARDAQARAKQDQPAPPAKPAAPKRPAFQKRRLFAHLANLSVSLGLVGAMGGAALALLYFAPREQIGADLWAVNRLASLVVTDRHGREIGARGARYGEAVEVAELPDYLIQAVLATEDRRFYSHHGVDLRGMTRAAVTNFREGGVVEGGSTITQQLAKNLFLSSEQVYDRKIREALLALWLEGHYDKDEILSLYLNRIYFGAGAYGIDQAARTYFGKSARNVSLSEAVMLAGLPKAPSSLAPTQNPFGAADRADEVLDNLLEIGAVTPFDARTARQNPPKIASTSDRAAYGYFFDYAAAKARDIVGAEAAHDLVIRTTIDPDLQRAAQEAVVQSITTETKIAGAEQAALIAYDRDGAMLAMVGGASYVQSQFNRATQAKRQPGSAFKPFVYAAALEDGMRPTQKFVDEPIDIDGWKPTNYSNKYLGPMRLTEAMAKSVNSVAVQVSESVGRQKVADMAKRLGVKADVPANPSIALGASNMTLEDLTGAYLPLARGGLSADPYAIERIENGRGEVLYERANPQSTRILSRKVSDDLNHLLYQVVYNGTGGRARLGRRAAVGKTGTTNEWRDAWFIGYTAQVTAGVWVGNDNYRGMDKVTGGGLPAEIWRTFMLKAHDGAPLRRIRGAAPAATYTDEGALLSYYRTLESDLERVQRERTGRGRFRRRP